MPFISLERLPFWLHVIFEVPASIKFFVDPSRDLLDDSNASALPRAEAVIRQYAVLLFVSAIISGIFALRRVDTTSRQVAAALMLYHVAPAIRAISRLQEGKWRWIRQDIGGPWLHLVVHLLCLAALGWLALGSIYAEEIPKKRQMPEKKN